MVIFLLGEDRAYLSWLAHHRNGFVLDWLRKPTKKQPTIHRASCDEIRISKTKNTHWTTGRHIKACSLELDELVSWAKDQTDSELAYCNACQPDDASVASTSGNRHLTKLGKEIVDHVVEVALIYLDHPKLDYHLTVGNIAECFEKSPAQLSSALLRLVTDGYLRLDQPIEGKTLLPDECKVYPTSDALRTLPSFEKMPKRKVESELESLTEEE